METKKGTPPLTQELCCGTVLLSCVPKPIRETPVLIMIYWHCDQIPQRWAAQGQGPDSGKARSRVAKGRSKWSPTTRDPKRVHEGAQLPRPSTLPRASRITKKRLP